MYGQTIEAALTKTLGIRYYQKIAKYFTMSSFENTKQTLLFKDSILD